MKKKQIALIYGGAGCEHDVSLRGANYVLSQIDRERYIPYPILIDRDGRWYKCGDLQLPVYPRLTDSGGVIMERGKRKTVAAAFPLLHGNLGEDGTVQGLLESTRIPYVGCGVLAGAVASDKIITKKIAQSLGIPTVTGVEITSGMSPECARALAEDAVGYPLFIKPSGLGSSVGACAVFSRDEFGVAYLLARASGGERILIEEYLEERRELECAYLDTGEGEIFTHPGEILVHGVYSFDEKYSEKSRTKTAASADIPRAVADRVIEYSRRLVDFLGIFQMSRIDFFLDGGRVYFNEINTTPGFTETSLYAAMLNLAGVSPKELITVLIEGAMRRGVRGGAL